MKRWLGLVLVLTIALFAVVSALPASAPKAPAPAEETVAPAIIQEVETITGTLDGHQLEGRRVDLSVIVAEVASARAFWIGEGDNRVLTVLEEGSVAAQPGERVRVAGMLRRLPKAEVLVSWQLSQAGLAEALERPVYISAR